MQGVHHNPNSVGTTPAQMDHVHLPHSPATGEFSSTKMSVATVLQLASAADPSKDFVLLSTSYSEHCLTKLLNAFFKLKGPGFEHGGHIVTIPLILLGPSFSQREGDLVLVRGPSFEGCFNGAAYVQRISNAMHSLYDRGIQLSAVLYLYDALQEPSSEAVRFNVLLLKCIIGEGFYRRLIIGTTHWNPDVSTLECREHHEGIFLNGVMRAFLDGGASVARIALGVGETRGPPTGFTHGVKTLREALADLVSALEGTGNQIPLMLDEIVRLQIPRLDTTAGRVAGQQGL